MRNPKLKQEYNDRFRNDYKVLGEIAEATKRSLPSVQRWFYDNSEMLTLMAALRIMAAHARVEPTDLIEEAENVTA